MIAFRDDAHVRSQVRGPLAPDRVPGDVVVRESVAPAVIVLACLVGAIVVVLVAGAL